MTIKSEAYPRYRAELQAGYSIDVFASDFMVIANYT